MALISKKGSKPGKGMCMDNDFYGHTAAGSIPPKGLKGQLSPVGIKADSFTAKTRVPSPKPMKGCC